MTSTPQTLMSWDTPKAPANKSTGLKDAPRKGGKRRPRTTHDKWDSDAYYARVQLENGEVPFIDVTAQLGEPCPYNRPLSFAAMRNTKSAVTISLQHLTKKQATRLAAETMQMPAAPLSRLHKVVERVGNDLEPGQMWVEHANGLSEMYNYTLDGSGVATLEHVGGADPGLELSVGGERLTIVMKSKKGRSVGYAFIGYMGVAKPGTPDTLIRLVTKALCSVSGLQAFQVLTGITRANVPERDQSAQIYREDVDAVGSVPVRLYRAMPGSQPEPLDGAHGYVKINFDLVTADNNINFDMTPSEELEAAFAVYSGVVQFAVSSYLRHLVGDALYNEIRANIILREVTPQDADTLLEALAQIELIEATPTDQKVTLNIQDA